MTSTGAIMLICAGIVLLWLVQTGKFTAIRAAWSGSAAPSNGLHNLQTPFAPQPKTPLSKFDPSNLPGSAG